MIREVIDNRDNLRYGVWELWERWDVIHAPSGIEPSSHVADEPSALPGTSTCRKGCRRARGRTTSERADD